MMKVTMIIGEPCVGKSLLIRELKKLDHWIFRRKKYLNHHYCHERKAILLGDYTDPSQKYPGTDRLSMACQPHFLDWVHMQALREEPSTRAFDSVIFEGDRLGNKSCIDALRLMRNQGLIDFEVIALTLNQEMLDKRRAEQRPDQNPTFWKSRNTKVNNLLALSGKGGLSFRIVEHVNLSDTHNLIAHIRKNRI